MKGGNGKKKKAGFRRVSFLVSDEEYKKIRKHARIAAGEKDVNKWAGAVFRFMINDLDDTANRQLAEHGVMFAEPGECGCPDCMGKEN
jgi:hypothetical protein